MNTNEERVKTLIAQHLGLSTEQIKLESRIVEDLGADSIDRLELALLYEDEFDIEIDDTAADRFVTVQDVVDYVNAHLIAA